MLVVSRKKNESIIIGNNITITIVDIIGDKVRLGFEAPKEIPIHRTEVYEAIKKEEAKKKNLGNLEINVQFDNGVQLTNKNDFGQDNYQINSDKSYLLEYI